jgi:hypothetical protein
MEGNESTILPQFGQVLEAIRALGDLMQVRQQQSEKLHDLLRTDVATLRADQRDLDEKLECVICVMQHDLEALRAGSAEQAHAVGELVSAVQALRRPISDIIALRSRVAGVVFGVGVVGSCALWIAEPVYRWLVEMQLPRR